MRLARPSTASSKPAAALNRLTLCFLDAETERDFRLQRSEASRAILRRFIVFMVLLVGFVTTGIRHKLELARVAGMPVPPQLGVGGPGLAFGAALALLLFLATLSRRFVPYLHTVTALCMAGLVLVDSWHSLALPLTYALYGTILNLVVLYVASQLRFATASLLGVAASMMYLCCAAAQHGPMIQADPLMQLQMGVTVTVLACTNLLLMFVTHQRELSARLAYHRARLLEQRSVELETALASLKQAELQLVENEKRAAAGRLVAGILHEMNTPLGALSSATQTLGRGLERVRAMLPTGSPAELVSTLDAAGRLTGVQAASGERIREVTERLKQFVSLDRAALQVADVRGGIETAAALIVPSLPAGVAVKLELGPCPIWVQCFPGRLNQVFLNLLKNAASAFDAQGPLSRGEIVVSARVAAGRLWVLVRDTGRGIDPQQLQRIFELDFSRQGSRVKLRLGLPASRGVVEAIGGSLTLESEVGRGSTAIIELPLGATPAAARAPVAQGSAPKEREPAAPLTAPAGGGARALPSL